MTPNDRKEKLLEVMKDLNKSLGSGLLKFGSDEKPKEMLTWGVQELDDKTKGISRGNFTVLYGAKSVGKSTLCYHAIAANQKKGFICCLIDMERNFDIIRATEMGIDVEALVLITSAETAEQAMDCIIKLTREKVVDLIIVDSVSAMSSEGEQTTKKGVEKSISDDSMALMARKLSQFFRICAAPVYKANCAVLLIGQVRKNLGSFIVTDKLSGGNALEHWARAIIALRHGQSADDPSEKYKEVTIDPDGKEHKTTKERKIGMNIIAKIDKTKVSGSVPEKTEFAIPFYFKSGFLPLVVEPEPTVIPPSADIVISSEQVTEDAPKKKGRPSKKG